MPASATTSLPLPARTSEQRIPLLDFLRRELAPFPGRGVATLRIVVACSAVLVLCMTLRVPEAHLAVWVVTRFAMEETSETLLTGVVLLLALTIGLAMPLVLLTFAMDQPALRFCLMASMAASGLFLRRTFIIGAFGFVIGLIGTLIMTAPDFILVPEQVVRATLWLWSSLALGIAAAVAANLLIAPTDPEALLREELTERLRAAEETLSRRLGQTGSDTTGATRFATAGVARLLKLLKTAEIVHPSLRPRHAQQSALITLIDRFVTTAATLDLVSPTPLRDDERERLHRIAEDCERVRVALANEPVQWPPRSSGASAPSAELGTALRAILVELEHIVRLMQQALGAEALAPETLSTGSRSGLFVPDAFTNAEHLRYAIKGTLAVMICYTLQNAVNWPGIRTCIITCLIVGLSSEGATVQKGTLRITGALVGAAMGFLSILLLIPGMESITSLTWLVAAGTAVAAWVVVGSPRISYAGVQLAFAFYVCVIQGFAPTWYFYTIRDRLIGILLGNAVITLVFQSIWPVNASDSMWTSFASALRAMAHLATVGSRSDDQAVVAEAAQGLRLQAYTDFAAAQVAADEAAFELSRAGTERMAARARLQRATADAQSVFLTQLAIAQQRPAIAPAELPDGVVAGARAFDAVVADYLEGVGDRVHGTARRVLPDLQMPLQATTNLLGEAAQYAATPEIAAHIAGRLQLYRELVPRIERLGSTGFTT
jgi:multidrug resistance protein MdtO